MTRVMADTAESTDTSPEPGLPEHLRDWKARLLRVAHGATTVSLILGSVVAFLSVGFGPGFAQTLVGFMLALANSALFLSNRGSRELRIISVLASLGIINAAILIGTGWSPAFSVVSVLLIVLGGIFSGPIAVYSIIAGICLALIGGGFLRNAQLLTADPSLLDPTILGHWLRTGAIVLVGASGTVYVLRYSMRVIREVHAATQVILKKTAAELRSSDEVRAARIETETKLQQTHKVQAVSQLSVGIAHHISNLLTVVRSAIDRMKLSTTTKEAQLHASSIEEVIKQSAELLAKLMVFTRQGGAVGHAIDVGSEIGGFHDGLKNAVRDDVQLRIRTEPDCPAVIDADELKQLVLAGVQNAADAVPRNGHIEIEVCGTELTETPLHALSPIDPGPYVSVTIRDNGTGMSAETRRRAADPFFTTKELEQHAGLGLSTALGITRKNGGGLVIETKPGHGTTITALLPRVGARHEIPSDADVAHAASATTPACKPSSARGVQDNAEVVRREPLPEAKAIAADQVPAATEEAAAAPWSIRPGDAGFDSLDQWQETYVLRLLRLTTWVIVLVMGLCAAFMAPQTLRSLLPALAVATAVAAYGGWAPWHGHDSRVWFLLCLGFVASPLLLIYSYMAAPPLVGVLSVIAVAAVLGSRAAALVALALLGAVFLIGGGLHSTGLMVAADGDYTITAPVNWFRTAGVLGLTLLLLARAVLDLVTHARRSIDRIRAATASLNQQRHTREQEGARILLLRQMAGSTASAEATGRLAGSVVHDLNNAMQAVIGCAWEIQSLRADEEEALSAAVQSLESTTDYATALVGRFNLRLDGTDSFAAVLDIPEIIERAARLVEQRLPDNIRIELRLPAHCHVRIDQSDIYRLVFNLVQNAQHAMPEGGCIILEIRPKGELEIEFAVQDNGLGMDEATRQRALEPFFTTKEASKGTGLGLMAVTSVATRSEGSVTIESEPGEGTQVCIRWRTQSPEQTQPVAVTEVERVSPALLLVADDHDQVREVFCWALREAGFRVLEARDGNEARALMSTHPDIDLFCFDGVMPGYPTQQLVTDAQVKAPDRPIIVCSGYLPDDLGTDLLRDGITFVQKPIGGIGLVQAVSKVLAHANAQQAAAAHDMP